MTRRVEYTTFDGKIYDDYSEALQSELITFRNCGVIGLLKDLAKFATECNTSDASISDYFQFFIDNKASLMILSDLVNLTSEGVENC